MNGSPDWSPKSKATAWCLGVAVLGALLALAPYTLQDTAGQGRHALVLIGALIGLTSLILIPYFRNRANVAEELLDEAQLLAHWTLSEEEWTAWISLDESAERRAKWKLFGLVLFFCVSIGGCFAWVDPKAGTIVLGVLLTLCVVIAVVIPWTLHSRRHGRLRAPREVRICKDGLRLGAELHIWHGFQARLEDVGLEEGPPCLLEVVYSTRAKNQRQLHELRVPVPAGRRQEALKVADFLYELRSRPS
jgi:hypothetical protein